MLLFGLLFLSFLVEGYTTDDIDCSTLRMGQFLCPDPDVNYAQHLVDPKTQQLRGCTKENKAKSK